VVRSTSSSHGSPEADSRLPPLVGAAPRLPEPGLATSAHAQASTGTIGPGLLKGRAAARGAFGQSSLPTPLAPGRVQLFVVILPEGKEPKPVELAEGATALDALRALGLPPDAYLVSRGDRIIPVDEPLQAGETLRLLPVISGGGSWHSRRAASETFISPLSL